MSVKVQESMTIVQRDYKNDASAVAIMSCENLDWAMSDLEQVAAKLRDAETALHPCERSSLDKWEARRQRGLQRLLQEGEDVLVDAGSPLVVGAGTPA